jgi:hypothetical protein
MSGRAPKQKGNRIERECVNLAKEFGFKSKRAWGSDGRSMGWHEEVDVTIDMRGTLMDKMFDQEQTVFKFQVKGRKAIADYLKPCEHVYGQILKEDRHEPLVTIRYEDLLTLFKMLTG